VPVGEAAVPDVLVTVAVYVIDDPYTTGPLAESLNDTDVDALFTCCETAVDVTAVKLALLL
jgi:hypothetical protein